MADESADITALLKNSRSDGQARESVFRMVYDDLRRIAGHRVSVSRPGETLSVTSLVNEAYLKLTERTGQQWNDRSHFLRVASKAMRQITIDHVRAKLTGKRGSGRAAVTLDGLQLAMEEEPEIILALEEGLEKLALTAPRLVEVVECKFFTGLTIPETALALGVSTRTVERDWNEAREWLKTFLTQ